MYKIIGADQKEYGPIDADQIRQWISEGRANGQTRACLEGTQDWRPLEAFPEFASLAAPSRPAPPGPAAYPASAEPAKPPGAIKVFGILNICFGALALLCTPFSLVSTTIAAKKIHYSPFMMHWLYVSAFLGIIAACVSIASGIGLLKRHAWARRLAIYYGVYCCIMALIAPAVTLTNLPEGGPNPEAGKMIALISVAIGVLVQLTYNILLIYFLSKPEVKQAMGERD
ncbi:MAG TPA: DUF4339 domain-containing protein [Candidatus Angelobacter sp.]|nr:DUF4339 domain-containing protein [Candidatus Angelobacter sp.]